MTLNTVRYGPIRIATDRFGHDSVRYGPFRSGSVRFWSGSVRFGELWLVTVGYGQFNGP